MADIEFSPLHRYLVRFHPKQIPHAFTDVLILGGGIAGLSAALEVPAPLQATVITKDALVQSNSAYAQGGIAGVLDPLDDIANHVADTITAGKGMCDPDVVEMVIREAPERIRQLVRLGTQFDLEDGHLALTREGGHSHRRIVHALGDATGKEIMRAMIERVKQAELIQCWPETFTIDLLTHDGVCRGALVWNPHHGKTFVWAKQTILATGGAGCLYRETTNPKIATADGHAIAARAGAELRDMEFMQFHPTVLYIAGSSRHLISEAVRGEGAYLRDASGHRFMADYDERLELAPRDVVSQAITMQMEKTKHPNVFLDLTHLAPELIQERFPHISDVCAEFGLDITRDLIPVRPGAHYMVGGVTVDQTAHTTLPGLWAAGEVTSTGLHGANRLASNSLLEGVVFGRIAGRGAAEEAAAIPDHFQALPLESDWPTTQMDEKDQLDLKDLRNALTSEMWRKVGIQRNDADLKEAGQNVEFWNRYVASREMTTPEGWELQNMMLVAKLMIAAARQRTESRGVHFRSDYPETDPAQALHITLAARRNGS